MKTMSTKRLKMGDCRRAIGAILLASAMGLSGSSPKSTVAAEQGNPNPGLNPPDSKPHGKSYNEWVVAQAQWLFALPVDQNPALDGEECVNGANGQSGPVWFLAGGGGGVRVRNCSVPVGKAVFVPVSASFCSVVEGDGSTEDELRECAQFFEDLNTVVVLEVDGVPLQGLDRYRLQSPLYEIVWPEDNLFGFPAGPDLAVSAGTFVMLAPLANGQHTIHRHVEASDGFMSDITWHLTVE